MKSFDPQKYSAAIARLLAGPRINELGPGQPNQEARDALASLTPQVLFGSAEIQDHQMAAACLSGLWLLHNFLDESHTISQDIDTPTGSYWHAIMHRREPDYSNSKYWFRRVGRHAIFDQLCHDAGELAAAGPVDSAANFLVEQSTWDAMQFVDLCESFALDHSTVTILCQQLQQREWELLFDHCYWHAVE